MSDPAYEQIGDRTDKVVEECAELIKAISKAKRFGYFGHHPDRPHKLNIHEIFQEMDDVNQAMAQLETKLREMAHEHYKNQK